jgi:hypothetical protein
MREKIVGQSRIKCEMLLLDVENKDPQKHAL